MSGGAAGTGGNGRIEVIGLTGQTGAGKSTASRYFRAHGCAVIDCDRVSREVSAPGTRCLAALAKEFSASVLTPDWKLDRRALGAIVFNDRQKLLRLGEIIFPFILKDIQERIAELERRGEPLVLLDAPTLFESGADRLCQRILSVTAGEGIRLSRIMERDGLSREEALQRIHSQLEEAYFVGHSDFIIENNGGIEALEARLAEALDWIRVASA